MTTPSLDLVWARIESHAGERFETIRGKPFSYVVRGNSLLTDRTDIALSRADFGKALQLAPLGGPGEISRLVRGPSYIWGILHDIRIRADEW